MNTSDSAIVDAYNANLTHSSPTALSLARTSLGSTNVGNYALVHGCEFGWIHH